MWTSLKLQRDCHVTFEGAYYSAPCRLVGQRLQVCGGLEQVRIFTADLQLVATHDRVGPGQRQTHPDHLPPEKLPGLMMDRTRCRARARQIDPATTQLVDRLRTAQWLLRLAVRTSAPRLEAACQRSLHYGDPSYTTVKRILAEGLEAEPPTVPVRAPAAHVFVAQRRGTGRLLGGRPRMALSHQLVPQLKLLRLSGILNTLERRQQEAIQGQWSYTDFLQRLLAQALGHEACRKGVQALLVDTDKMLKHLHGGRVDGSWQRHLTTYLRADLLLLDDFGLEPLSPPGPEDLYDVINERYEQGSIILTSNRAPAEWPGVLRRSPARLGRTGPPGAPGRGRRHPRRFLPRQAQPQAGKGGTGRHRRRLIRSPQESAAGWSPWAEKGWHSLAENTWYHFGRQLTASPLRSWVVYPHAPAKRRPAHSLRDSPRERCCRPGGDTRVSKSTFQPDPACSYRGLSDSQLRSG